MTTWKKKAEGWKDYAETYKQFYDKATDLWQKERSKSYQLDLDLAKAKQDLDELQKEYGVLVDEHKRLHDFLENVATIDPNLTRFLDDNGDWDFENAHRAAEHVRGYEAVKGFDL